MDTVVAARGGVAAELALVALGEGEGDVARPTRIMARIPGRRASGVRSEGRRRMKRRMGTENLVVDYRGRLAEYKPSGTMG